MSKRPAKTLAQQNKGQGVQIAVASKDAGEKATTLKLERVPDSDRGKLVAHAQEMRKARQERVKIESQSGPIEDKPPENPRRVKSAGMVPGGIVAAAAADKAKSGAPKDPELPKNVAEPDPRREPSKRGGKRLRDPSLDLPARGEKPGEDAAGGPDKKAGVKEVEPDREKNKAENTQPKKPGDDQPAGKRPGISPAGNRTRCRPRETIAARARSPTKISRRPRRLATTNSLESVPVSFLRRESPPAIRRPRRIPPRTSRRPRNRETISSLRRSRETISSLKKPGDDQQPPKKPGDDQQPPKKPGFSPPARKPGEDQPPGKKPDSQPPKKPGLSSATEAR